MSTSLSSLYIVNRRPAELCLESDVALCRGGERCTQEGQADGASLQPGSAWRRLDAPKPPPVAPASEPAENRRALKSSSHLSGGAGTPGRGPGGRWRQAVPHLRPRMPAPEGAPPNAPRGEAPRFPPRFATGRSWDPGQAAGPLGLCPHAKWPRAQPPSGLRAPGRSAPGGEAAWPSASLRPIWPRGPAFSCL